MTRTHLKTILTLHALAFLAVLALPVGVFAQETFVPLTSLPGVTELAKPGTIVSGDSLPAFFNSLYRLCIGAAAVIAVVQIIRAGIKFMSSSGSISANQEAKALLGNAIFGIILVLSPVIVFGIINPDILRLDLDLGSLQLDNGQATSTADQVVSMQQCSAYIVTTASAGSSCNSPAGYTQIANSCCSGASAGTLCCGRLKNATSTQSVSTTTQAN